MSEAKDQYVLKAVLHAALAVAEIKARWREILSRPYAVSHLMTADAKPLTMCKSDALALDRVRLRFVADPEQQMLARNLMTVRPLPCERD